MNDRLLHIALESLSHFALTYPNIINKVYQLPLYNDEPKIYSYCAQYSNNQNEDRFSYGFSFNKKKAYVKVLGEAIERFCLDAVDEGQLVCATVSELQGSSLDPKSISSFSKKQLLKNEFKKFRVNAESEFKWVKGVFYNENTSIFIPAQLIYTQYHSDNEPIIRFPISTGAAAGGSFEQALYGGICEIVERDAFMIHYLHKLPGRRIDHHVIKNDEVKHIVAMLERYLLELYIFDITTDLGIPVYAAYLFDKTGQGPAISVGLKAGFNLLDVLIGAVEESLMVRNWVRERYIFGNKTEDVSKKIETDDQRAYFWLKPEMIKHLDFLFEDDSMTMIKMNRENFDEQFRQTIQSVKNANCRIYYVDITDDRAKQAGFFVVKVFIPELYPMYFREEYPYLGINRLYDTPKKLGLKTSDSYQNLNTMPHPFL